MSELRAPSWPSATQSDVQGIRIPDRTLHLLRDLIDLHTGMYYD